jgi:hypothetical protein
MHPCVSRLTCAGSQVTGFGEERFGFLTVLNRQHLHHALELAQYNLPGGSRRGEKPSRYLVSVVQPWRASFSNLTDFPCATDCSRAGMASSKKAKSATPGRTLTIPAATLRPADSRPGRFAILATRSAALRSARSLRTAPCAGTPSTHDATSSRLVTARALPAQTIGTATTDHPAVTVSPARPEYARAAISSVKTPGPLLVSPLLVLPPRYVPASAAFARTNQHADVQSHRSPARATSPVAIRAHHGAASSSTRVSVTELPAGPADAAVAAPARRAPGWTAQRDGTATT